MIIINFNKIKSKHKITLIKIHLILLINIMMILNLMKPIIYMEIMTLYFCMNIIKFMFFKIKLKIIILMNMLQIFQLIFKKLN